MTEPYMNELLYHGMFIHQYTAAWMFAVLMQKDMAGGDTHM